MDRKPQSDIEHQIAAALRDDDGREAPAGFHQRVRDRIRIAALLRREQRRFRVCVSLAAFVGGSLILASGLAWFVGDFPGVIARAIPGVLGFYDHLAALSIRHWSGIAASVFGLSLFLGTLTVLLERVARGRGNASPVSS